ncbi:MAG TPA: hypothetical protein VHH36_06370, partial [Candidatus Thermoplasmatota archaeon]|nr:hypothetical protein [Candidatus Thermoplasmatota archaeon]
MTPTLAVAATLSLAMSALYAYVGTLVLRRPTSDAARPANRSFGLWWNALAVTMGLDAARAYLAAFGVLDGVAQTALLYLILPPIVAAIYGLVDYLVYLYTGDPRWRGLVRAFHLAVGAGLLAAVVWMRPLRA